MNLLLLEAADFTAKDTAIIRGRRLRQLNEVIRAEAGKVCKAGVLGGDRGRGEIVEITSNYAVVRFIPERPPLEPGKITLVCALPRPKSFTKVLHAAVETGVKELNFIQTFKVDKSYWSAPRLAPEAVREELLLALEQSGDTILPQVHFFPRFKIFVEDVLPQIASGTTALFGDPAGVPAAITPGKITLAVGPEGGFTDYEKRKLGEAGFAPISLGERTLRTEFAVAALLAKLG